jgi:N-acetylglutamate synthase-like GNAT family acetyltransferase
MDTTNSTHTNPYVSTPPFKKLSFGINAIKPKVAQPKNKEIAPIDLENLQYKELTLLAEKKKWINRFMKAYPGLLAAETNYLYTDKSKFIVACYGTHEIGFLRLTDDADVFSPFTNEESWDITDVYIKPAYQGLGVLQVIIQHVITNEHAKSVTLAYEVAEQHASYYKMMGFTVVANIFEINCVRLFLTDWEEVLAKACERVAVQASVLANFS